jgi:hypothetical protein
VRIGGVQMAYQLHRARRSKRPSLHRAAALIFSPGTCGDRVTRAKYEGGEVFQGTFHACTLTAGPGPGTG